MLLDPGQNVGQVEYGARWRADGVRKGLEGEGAEIEWQALERRMRTASSGLAYASARAS